MVSDAPAQARSRAPPDPVRPQQPGDRLDVTRRRAEAAEPSREVLDTKRRVLGDKHPDTLYAIVTLAEVYLDESISKRLNRSCSSARGLQDGP